MRKRLNAEALLALLQERHPEGVPVSEAALILCKADGPRQRARVYRMARALRDTGFAVYAIGGVYYLCGGDPEKLLLVGERKENQVAGNIEGFLRVVEETVDALAASPDPVKKALFEELRRRVRRRILNLARKLA